GLESPTGVVRRDPDLHTTLARTLSISATLIAPCRRILIWSVVQSTTVDETPPGVVPPSSTSAIRPSSCAITSCAVRASGSPERLALVTGRPPPLAAMSRRASGWYGTRNAFVPRRVVHRTMVHSHGLKSIARDRGN